MNSKVMHVPETARSTFLWEGARSMKRLHMAVLLLALTLSYAHSAQYGITDLGVLAGHVSSYPVTLNNNGEVVGYSVAADNSSRPFVYRQGVINDVWTLVGPNVGVRDINDSGVIVGQLNHPVPGSPCMLASAFAWYPDSGLVDLGVLVEGGSSHATAINSNGQIVGSSDYNSGSVAFIWDTTDGMRPIPTHGGRYGEAYDIDSWGHVLGSAQTSGSNPDWLPFLYDGSILTSLRESGMIGNGTFTNDSGQVAGNWYDELGVWYAFVWGSQSGTYRINLGPGNRCRSVSGFNNAGQVVGTYDQLYSPEVPFLYSDGQLLRLEDLLPSDVGWSGLSLAGFSGNCLNDRGQIVGRGWINGERHAFLMTPVPEPSGVLALGSGLFAVVFPWLRRRRA